MLFILHFSTEGNLHILCSNLLQWLPYWYFLIGIGGFLVGVSLFICRNSLLLVISVRSPCDASPRVLQFEASFFEFVVVLHFAEFLSLTFNLLGHV